MLYDKPLNPPSSVKQNPDISIDLSASPEDLAAALVELAGLFRSPTLTGRTLCLLWEMALHAPANTQSHSLTLLLLASTAKALAERRP